LITEVKSALEGLRGTYTAEVHTLSKKIWRNRSL
jgi:hypothetical protein